MLDILNYLNDPNIVANVQRYFGIEAQFQKSNKKSRKKHTINDDHKINSMFWYYIFHIGATFGTESFYTLFFPIWFWNIDSVIFRKISIIWASFMYVGQATKDIFEIPRPASPPVVKVEKQYAQEYGFPSTHAMIAAGFPLALVYLSQLRYNINLHISIVLSVIFCLWVTTSRLYLGMHSLLDVICGSLYAILVFCLISPFIDTIDKFQLSSRYAPYVISVFGFLLCFFYPNVKVWNTSRRDTTIIVGTVVGFSIGSYISNCSGFMHKPATPPLYDIVLPSNSHEYLYILIRTLLGFAIVITVRNTFKFIIYQLTCLLYGYDATDPLVKQKKNVELSYCFLTYIAMGVSLTYLTPIVFRYFNIDRNKSFTEL